MLNEEILDEILAAIEKHTDRLNSLDGKDGQLRAGLDGLEAKITNQMNLAITTALAKIDKPDYSLLERILTDDFDRLITKHNLTVKDVERSLRIYLDKLMPSDKVVEDIAIKHVNSIRKSLKGDKGDTGAKGDKGDTGLNGKDGKDGKDGKNGRDGKDGKNVLLKDIKGLIKTEVDKLPKSTQSPIVAPVAPQSNGLSMIAVKKEIDSSIANIGTVLTEDGTNTLTNKTLDSYTNTIHADSLHRRVKNVSGGVISAGQPVSYIGYNSGEDAIEIDLADSTISVSIGIAEAELANNAFGMITIAGILEGIDTSGYNDGDILYVNGSGALTDVRPIQGFVQPIAFVLAAKNNGTLQVLAAYPESITGWKDLVSTVAAAAPSPSNQPALTNFGPAGTMQRMEYVFANGDYVFMAPYHVNHDISPGAKAYLHIHWTTNGTEVGTVTWRLHIQRARGHNQEPFGTPYYIQLVADTSGTAYQHMVSEVNAASGVVTTTSDASDPVITLTEPDEVIIVTLEKETDTVTDDVFGLQVDFHYESNRDTTINRVPNFYA